MMILYFKDPKDATKRFRKIICKTKRKIAHMLHTAGGRVQVESTFLASMRLLNSNCRTTKEKKPSNIAHR
jgi:hypothetical protein